jgi:hypothetical protein
MKEDGMDPRIARLLDRQEIQDLLARYCRAVDRRDWAKLGDVFHADAHDDHGEYKGGVEGFLAWVKQRHASIGQSMHFLGNCLIEFAGDDVALVETYFVASQRLGAEAGPAARKMLEQCGADSAGAVDLDVLGRYIDRMERRAGGPWKIARRTVAFDAVRARPATGGPLNPLWGQARRDPDDPVFAERRAIGLRD